MTEDIVELVAQLKEIKNRDEFISKIRLSKNIRKINMLKIARVECGNTKEGAELFNLYYKWLVLENPHKLRKIDMTKSGGIQIKECPQLGYDWDATKSGVSFIYLGKEGAIKVIFSQKPDGPGGAKCYRQFKKICREKFKFDLEKYAITNGEEVKKEIENAKIDLVQAEVAWSYKNAHHLDLNSSYMSGIALKNPELLPAINYIYEQRKKDPVCKDILTHTFGYFQSKFCRVNNYRYAYAHLSKQAIEFNNRTIEKLTEELKANGNKILAYNTDGIWYTGDLFHNEHEGPGLGNWKNDHTNCTIRFKSKGAYEFIEDGKYYPVVRGLTQLDRIKPREKWEWGDIFSVAATVYRFKFNEEYGIKIETD